MSHRIPSIRYPGPRLREFGFGSVAHQIVPIALSSPDRADDPLLDPAADLRDLAGWSARSWQARLYVGLLCRSSEAASVRVEGLPARYGIVRINCNEASSRSPWIDGATGRTTFAARPDGLSYIGISVNGDVLKGYLLVERSQSDRGVAYRVSTTDMITLAAVMYWLDLADEQFEQEFQATVPTPLPVVEVSLFKDSRDGSSVARRWSRHWNNTPGFWSPKIIEGTNGMIARCLHAVDLSDIGVDTSLQPAGDLDSQYSIVEITHGVEKAVLVKCWHVDPYRPIVAHSYFIAASSQNMMTLVNLLVDCD